MKSTAMHYAEWRIYQTVLVVLISLGYVGTCTAVNTGTASPHAVQAIKNHGLTKVQVGGWSPLSCGGDTLSREFSATSPSGKRVSGFICGGVIFKGYTVRW